MVANSDSRPPVREQEETLRGLQRPVSSFPEGRSPGCSLRLSADVPVGGVAKQGTEQSGEASLWDPLRDTAELATLPTDLRPASDRHCHL